MYVPVHPIDGDQREGTIAFDATFPTTEKYRCSYRHARAVNYITGAFDVTLPFEA